MFLEWRAERNRKAALTPESGSREECPEDHLDNPDTQKLNYWLSRFVTKVRRQDGQPYPPRSVHQILAGLQRKMLEKHPDAPNLLDSKEPAFSVLHRTCDTVYRDQRVGRAHRSHSHVQRRSDTASIEVPAVFCRGLSNPFDN